MASNHNVNNIPIIEIVYQTAQQSENHSDSVPPPSFIKEIKVPVNDIYSDSFFSQNINSNRPADWYLLIIIGMLAVIAWIKMIYNKYLINLFESSLNYQIASKIYGERGIIQKRTELIFDLIYFINLSLFLLVLYRFFSLDFLDTNDFGVFTTSILFLFVLMSLRVIIMRLTGYLFDRNSLFSEFLYHFYLYTKIIGIVLFPFILVIPYTQGFLHKVLIYIALMVLAMIYLLRIFRAILFTIKNVLLLFYLILYLCALELLPVIVIIKLILSLT